MLSPKWDIYILLKELWDHYKRDDRKNIWSREVGDDYKKTVGQGYL